MPHLHPIPLYIPSSSERLYPSQNASIHGPKTFVDLVENAPDFTAIYEGFKHFLSNKIYFPKKEHIYWYRISTGEACYAGLLCGLPTKECSHPSLTTHEDVFDHRVRLFSSYLAATQLQAEPILVLHENNTFSDEFMAKVDQKECTHSFKLGEQKHELWALNAEETAEVKAFAQAEKQFHLADGHHRLASSLQFAKNKQVSLRVFSFIIAKNQLKNDRFVWALKQFPKGCTLQETKTLQAPTERPTIGYLSDHRTQYIAYPKNTNAATFLFEDVLGFSAQDAIDLSEYIDYFPPTDNLTVDFFKSSAPYKAKFFYAPLGIEEIIQTAKAQEKLPPKSTYLRPKLPTGLFIAPTYSVK